jgi:hypothetical protein
MRPTRREQRRARRALLRQVISIGFALVIASARRRAAR